MKARLLSILVGIAVVISLSTGAVSASDPPGTVTLQPGPGLNDGSDDGSATKGKDTWIHNGGPAYGPATGGNPSIDLWNISCNPSRGRGLLRFSMDGLPTQNIISAKVYMYTSVFFNGNGWPWPAGDQQVSVRKLTSDWNEKTQGWDNPPSFDPAIIDPKVVHTVGKGPPGKAPYIEFQDWLSFDITDLYKGWANGSIPNYGVMFYLDTSVCQNGDSFNMYTSDYSSDVSLRPKLVVTAAPGGNIKGDGNADGKVKGDFNGDGKVTELDALAALKMSVKQLPEDLALDMDGNSKVMAADARLILKKALGK